MRFRPESDYRDIDVLTKAAMVRECAAFEASLSGTVFLRALTEARDDARNIIRSEGVSQRDADRANGALDILEHILEFGVADHRKIALEIGK